MDGRDAVLTNISWKEIHHVTRSGLDAYFLFCDSHLTPSAFLYFLHRSGGFAVHGDRGSEIMKKSATSHS